MINVDGVGDVERNVNNLGNAMGLGWVSGSTTALGGPLYTSPLDSGLTSAVPQHTRKRSRLDAISTSPVMSTFLGTAATGVTQNQIARNRCDSFSFLGEYVPFQIQAQQQQLQIDQFVAQHAEKVRVEIEQRTKAYTRRIAAAVDANIMKKMKVKEEEMEKMGKLNSALEERVKVLSMENQIWRDLAQTNEAVANALRCNLEQVTAYKAQSEQKHRFRDPAMADDAQSCCGSNYDEITAEVAGGVGGNNINAQQLSGSGTTAANGDKDMSSSRGRLFMCRSCWKQESCVLLLPCRHLCLCAVCGTSLHTCPICKSTKSATLHVNLFS